MIKHLLYIFLLSTSYADNESGCSVAGLVEVATNPLIQENNCSDELSLKDKDKKTGMSETLMSVKVVHESEEILIERELLSTNFSCPPFCIQPIKIKEVATLGELEVLEFIDKLKEKKSRLLIDVRENVDYAKSTIPGAINLPFSMLTEGSKYQEEILKLLGGKKNQKQWIFKNPQLLLIFGKNVISYEASSMINQLISFGYPTNKIFFYRAGFESWKSLGLTIY